MQEGKVCYADEETVDDMPRLALFNAINGWAKKYYGKDYVPLNVRASKKKGTISVSSKIELPVEGQGKTILKYKLRIECFDNRYTVAVSDLTYRYDPAQGKDYHDYAAEEVIAQNGKANTVAAIKDPEAFCNATYFFVENLFSDISIAAEGE